MNNFQGAPTFDTTWALEAFRQGRPDLALAMLRAAAGNISAEDANVFQKYGYGRVASAVQQAVLGRVQPQAVMQTISQDMYQQTTGGNDLFAQSAQGGQAGPAAGEVVDPATGRASIPQATPGTQAPVVINVGGSSGGGATAAPKAAPEANPAATNPVLTPQTTPAAQNSISPMSAPNPMLTSKTTPGSAPMSAPNPMLTSKSTTRPAQGIASFVGGKKGLIGMKKGGSVHHGPTVLHVGERKAKRGDKFASDEYVYADPGVGGKVVVAPRKKSEKPSLKNAVRALRQQEAAQGGSNPMMAMKMMGMEEGGLVKAEDGAGVYSGGDILTQLLQALTGPTALGMATELPLTQLQIMAATGKIDPRVLGVTDPAQMRDLLAQNHGTPTLAATQGQQDYDLRKLLGEGSLDVQRQQLGETTQDRLLRERLGLMGDTTQNRGLDITAANNQGQLALGNREADIRERLGMQSDSTNRYLGELGLQGTLGAANASAGAQRYSADASAGASRYGSELGLEGQKYGADVTKLLGLENIGLGRERLGLDTEMGRGDLGLRERLGMGQLELGRGQLAELGGFHQGQLNAENRRINLQEADQAFQRAIRGLKSLPSVGNVASGAPSWGNAGL